MAARRRWNVVGLDIKTASLNAPLGDVHDRNKRHRVSEDEAANPEAEDPGGEADDAQGKDEEEMQTLPMDEMETQPMEDEPDLRMQATEVIEDDSVGMHTKEIEEIMIKMVRSGDRSRLMLMQPPKILERLGLKSYGW